MEHTEKAWRGGEVWTPGRDCGTANKRDTQITWVPDPQPCPSDLKPRTQAYSTAAVSHQGSFNR